MEQDGLQLYDSGLADNSDIVERPPKEKKPRSKSKAKRAFIVHIPSNSTENDIENLKSKFNELVRYSKNHLQSIREVIFLLFLINFTWTILEIEIAFFTPLLSVLVVNVIVIAILLNHLNMHLKHRYDTLKFFKFLTKVVSGQLLVLAGCELLILVGFFYHKYEESTNWSQTSGLITIYFAPVKVFFYFLIALHAVEHNLLRSKFSIKHEEERQRFKNYHLQLKTFMRFTVYLSMVTFVTGFWLLAELKHKSMQVVHIVLSIAAFHAVVLICCGFYFVIKNYARTSRRRGAENI